MSINRDLADSAAIPPFRKNIIINGDMRIWQRGTSFSPPSGFTADRFTWVQAGTGAVAATRDPATPVGVGRHGYALKIAVVTTDTPAAGEVYGIRYPIEAQDMAHLNIGTTAAKTVTLSFRVASSKTGIHSGSFRNQAADRSYVFEYTINATNTWETKTVTIDLDTTGTWLADNNLGMDIFFSIATGTTFQGTVDAWTAGNFVGSANQVNVMDNTANSFWLTNVQLEEGTEATDFDYRPIGEELALCQRYYNKSNPYDIDPGTSNSEGAWTFVPRSVSDVITVPFPVVMRTRPTMTWWSPTGTINKWTAETSGDYTPTVLSGRSSGARLAIQNTGPSAGQLTDGHWEADAEL